MRAPSSVVKCDSPFALLLALAAQTSKHPDGNSANAKTRATVNKSKRLKGRTRCCLNLLLIRISCPELYIISESTPGGHFIATGYDKGETCELPMPELTALEYQLQLGLFFRDSKSPTKVGTLTPSTETLTLICAPITFRVYEILSRLARLSYYHFTGGTNGYREGTY